MPFIPVPDCALAKLQFTLVDDPATTWSVGLWFAQPDFGSAQLETLASELSAGFCTDLMLAFAAAAVLNDVACYDMRSVDGFVAHAGTNIAGGAGGGIASIGATLVVSFYGNLRGPWNRGRNSLSGFNEDDLGARSISQTRIDEIVGYYQSLIDDPPTSWTWAVVSRYLDGEPRAAGVYTPVVRVLARNAIQGRMQGRVDRP